jgi:hypothetical protein
MSVNDASTRAQELELLKRRYAEVCAERDRLRNARGGVTARLGPLPASAAIVIGLVGAAAHRVDRGYLIAAGLLFVALIEISARYSSLAPYRMLLAKRHDAHPETRERYVASTVDPSLGYARWLDKRTREEEQIYGPLRSRQPFTLTRDPQDLQEAFDVERSASNVVQYLFAAIILVLLAGLIAG